MKICPKCGKEYSNIKNFCSICKERLIINIVEEKNLKEKRKYVIIGIIFLLLVAFVVFLVPFQYNTIQAYCKNYTYTYVEYYVEEEPYNDTEHYNETEFYTATEHINYRIIRTREDVIKCRSISGECYCTGTIGIIENIDNVGGNFVVEVSFFSSRQQTLYTKIGSLSSSYFLKPNESKTVDVHYTGKCDTTKIYYRIDKVISPTKEVIKNKTIPKTRSVIKYKNVTKTREIIKHHSVKRQREIIKNATLFEQWTGKVARYEDVNCVIS